MKKTAFKMKAGEKGPMKKNFPSVFKKDNDKKKSKLKTAPGTTRITDKDLINEEKIEKSANKGNVKDQLVRKYMSGITLTKEELAIFNKK